MSDITLRRATLNDIEAMQRLVAPYVQNGAILMRSDDELSTNIRSYVLALIKEELVGYCALHIHSKTLAEVRSLVVREDSRHKKIGSKIVSELICEAKSLGVREILSLTYIPEFFTSLDFKEIAKEDIPNHKIWADCIKCKHFPICNEIAMIKTIS